MASEIFNFQKLSKICSSTRKNPSVDEARIAFGFDLEEFLLGKRKAVLNSDLYSSEQGANQKRATDLSFLNLTIHITFVPERQET